MKSDKKSKGLITKILGITAKFLLPLLIFLVWMGTDTGNTFNYGWRDFLFSMKGGRQSPADVVVVAIDEPTFQEIGLRWPWPRTIHADLITELKRQGAKAIGFDVMFVEPSPDPKDDMALAEAAKKAGNVVFGVNISQIKRQGYEQIQFVEPLPVLGESAKETAFVNLIPDSDGIIRKSEKSFEGRASLSFATVRVSGLVPEVTGESVKPAPLAVFGNSGNDDSTDFPKDVFENVENDEFADFPKDVFENAENEKLADSPKDVSKNAENEEFSDFPKDVFENAENEEFADFPKDVFKNAENEEFTELSKEEPKDATENKKTKSVSVETAKKSAANDEFGDFPDDVFKDAENETFEETAPAAKPVNNDALSNNEEGLMTAQSGREFNSEDLEKKKKAPSFLIDFAGPSGTITTVSYYQVLRKSLPEGFFKNKVVLVGLSSESAVEVEGAVDAFPTPFFRFSQKMMYGVEIHANAMATILSGFPLNMAPTYTIYILLLLSYLPYLVMKRPVVLAVATPVIVVGLGVFSGWLFISQHLIQDVLPVIAATIGSATLGGIAEYRATAKEKKQIKGAFDRYVTPDVVKAVLKNPDLLRLGGEKRELSVLFSDIRGFTTLSEGLDPEQLVSLLNIYLTDMTDEVFKNYGTLDKYIGDAIMAIFGAPLPRDDHADCACRTVLGMLKALEILNEDWKNKEYPLLRIGVGVNTGFMVVGNMGSEKRFDYTVMGDEVNLGSRLEGLTKSYSVCSIISESTQNALSNGFFCRELDLVRVKGKKKPVKIFELIMEGEPSEALKKAIDTFALGLSFYREQKWLEAEDNFKRVLELRPEDGPAKVFIERVEILRENSPGVDWDGVWTMTTK